MTQMPAFPNSGAYGHTGDYLPEAGMTLRDWFAGQALSSVTTTATGLGDATAEERAEGFHAVAGLMYELADAMLAARATTASKEGEA